MYKLKELIAKAKQKNLKAMGDLFNKFKPLLKSRAKRYSRMGLEYDDVFQQGALLFILAVYDYQEKGSVPFQVMLKRESTGDCISIIVNIFEENQKFLLA